MVENFQQASSIRDNPPGKKCGIPKNDVIIVLSLRGNLPFNTHSEKDYFKCEHIIRKITS